MDTQLNNRVASRSLLATVPFEPDLREMCFIWRKLHRTTAFFSMLTAALKPLTSTVLNLYTALDPTRKCTRCRSLLNPAVAGEALDHVYSFYSCQKMCCGLVFCRSLGRAHRCATVLGPDEGTAEE